MPQDFLAHQPTQTSEYVWNYFLKNLIRILNVILSRRVRAPDPECQIILKI